MVRHGADVESEIDHLIQEQVTSSKSIAMPKYGGNEIKIIIMLQDCLMT